MSARPSQALLRMPDPVRLRQWTRKTVTLLLLLASVSALGLIVRNQYGDGLREWLAAGLPLPLLEPATAAPTPAVAITAEAEPARADPNESRYRALADFLARRYRVSQDATLDLVSFAHAAGHQLGLDPLLIIAVIAVESRFNPIAESVAGAKGLMQVIPKYHTDKLAEFGGEQAVFDPRINILVGSRILKEYVRRTGDTIAALQMYAGASDDLQDGYSTKVLSEKKRLQSVLTQPDRKSVRVAEASPLQVERGRQE